jgi:hypothetical protein
MLLRCEDGIACVATIRLPISCVHCGALSVLRNYLCALTSAQHQHAAGACVYTGSSIAAVSYTAWRRLAIRVNITRAVERRNFLAPAPSPSASRQKKNGGTRAPGTAAGHGRGRRGGAGDDGYGHDLSGPARGV